MKADKYTPKYKIDSDRFGNYTITDIFKNKSVYLQGDDATIIDREMDNVGRMWITHSKVWPFSCMEEHIDIICSQYDDVMEKTVNMYM